MVIVLSCLSDMGHLDSGSRKELEFHLDVGWGGRGQIGSIPSWMLQQPFLEGDDLSVTSCWQQSLSDSEVTAAASQRCRFQQPPA